MSSIQDHGPERDKAIFDNLVRVYRQAPAPGGDPPRLVALLRRLHESVVPVTPGRPGVAFAQSADLPKA